MLIYTNATTIWIGNLILQIITTLTSAYSTFSILIDRLFIYKIKVFKVNFICFDPVKYIKDYTKTINSNKKTMLQL